MKKKKKVKTTIIIRRNKDNRIQVHRGKERKKVISSTFASGEKSQHKSKLFTELGKKTSSGQRNLIKLSLTRLRAEFQEIKWDGRVAPCRSPGSRTTLFVCLFSWLGGGGACVSLGRLRAAAPSRRRRGQLVVVVVVVAIAVIAAEAVVVVVMVNSSIRRRSRGYIVVVFVVLVLTVIIFARFFYHQYHCRRQ